MTGNGLSAPPAIVAEADAPVIVDNLRLLTELVIQTTTHP